MRKFLFILLFSLESSSEKHSLRFFSTGFPGIPNFPDFVGIAELDGIEAAYCDSNKTIKPKQQWVKTIMQTDPDQLNWYKTQCFETQPYRFKVRINNLMQDFNQSEGVHIVQRIHGCEWDDETGEVESFMKYGYDGEDLISFDMKSRTWIALKPEAVNLKLSLDAYKSRLNSDVYYFIEVFPEWLKKYVDVARSSLLRRDLPSVSLLQKSPSSPVTCHATGFYPDRAVIFWRRDGEELFEDVEHGEILPNHDGSFQMSVDLLRLPSEDWRRYECLFQLDGVQNEILTRLDQALIRTNLRTFPVYKKEDHGRNPLFAGLGVVAVLIFVVFPVAAVVVFLVYRQRKATKTRTESPEDLNLQTPSCTQQQPEEEETLNPEPVGSNLLRGI